MMRVKLLRDARINCKAGEIVEVSPTEYAFLTSLGAAEDAVTKSTELETPEKPAPVKKSRKKR